MITHQDDSHLIGLDCEICFEAYDMKHVKPLVLECGHTICNNCLNNILQSRTGKKCPFDKKDLKGRSDQYPINWTYVNIINSKEWF